MDRMRAKKLWQKWKTCKVQSCDVNVTDSYAKAFECECCKEWTDEERKRWKGQKQTW